VALFAVRTVAEPDATVARMINAKGIWNTVQAEGGKRTERERRSALEKVRAVQLLREFSTNNKKNSFNAEGGNISRKTISVTRAFNVWRGEWGNLC